MTPEEVQAMITASIEKSTSTLKTELTNQINTANQGLAANLTREIAKINKPKEAPATPTPDDKPKGKAEGDPADDDGVSLEMKAMRTQLEKLNSDLDAERTAKEKASAANALSGAIADSGAQNPSALRTLLEARYGDNLKEESGAWYVSDGTNTTPLAETVKTYLASDEGKFFVPASGVKGSGSKETKTTATKTADPTTVEGAFMEAFADL